MKICTIVGARPQFIKAAVVSRVLRRHRDGVRELIVHTGQHYDANMSDVFFEELDIPRPDFHLGIGGGTHGQNTGRMLESIEATLLEERPDWVLVYGDTDSTLAGALAAVKLHVPVAHVEAGLRSFNFRMPEEINRILTDHASTILFTPTGTATRNLRREGMSDGKVHQVGDVMYDAVLHYGELAEQRSGIVDELRLQPKSYVLATVHRAENTDCRVRMEGILAGFARCPLPIVWPVHPRTRKCIADLGLVMPNNVQAIGPVGYLDMVLLEKRAARIATDSGGVQKEAFFHDVPCVTLRDETEWTELVEYGANTLVGTDPEAIGDALARAQMPTDVVAPLYGRGDAGARIADILLEPEREAP